MPSHTFKKVKVRDEDLNRVQDNVGAQLNPLLSIPILEGRLVETIKDANGNEVAILLTTSFLNIPHKLGRKYRGYIITSMDQNATVWEDPTAPGPTANPDVTKFLRLRAAGTDVNVKLWVF